MWVCRFESITNEKTKDFCIERTEELLVEVYQFSDILSNFVLFSHVMVISLVRKRCSHPKTTSYLVNTFTISSLIISKNIFLWCGHTFLDVNISNEKQQKLQCSLVFTIYRFFLIFVYTTAVNNFCVISIKLIVIGNIHSLMPLYLWV